MNSRNVKLKFNIFLELFHLNDRSDADSQFTCVMFIFNLWKGFGRKKHFGEMISESRRFPEKIQFFVCVSPESFIDRIFIASVKFFGSVWFGDENTCVLLTKMILISLNWKQ